MKTVINNNEVALVPISGSEGCFAQVLMNAANWNEISLHHVLINPNCTITNHTHEKQTEAHYIISGLGNAILGEQSIPIHKGDIVIAYPFVPHEIQNNGSEPLELLCIFNPPLE